MGKLRPLGYSPNKRSFARCVAVVIVKLLSNMSRTLFGLQVQNYTKIFDFNASKCKNHIKYDRFVQISRQSLVKAL